MATYAKGRERRAEIIRVARDVFATRGFRSASLAVIAERAGLSEPGLLHHFPSKDHLLTAVLEERDDPEIERTRRQVEEEHCQPRRGAARPLPAQRHAARDGAAVHRARRGERRRRAPGARVVRRALPDGSARCSSTASSRSSRRAGWPPDADLEQLAIEIVAMFDGLQLQWLLDRERVDMVAPFERFIARALPGPPPPRR